MGEGRRIDAITECGHNVITRRAFLGIYLETIMIEDFDKACEYAKLRSTGDAYQGCSVHVNAVLMAPTGDEPFILGYVLSDWTDGSTLRTYVNGEEL